MARFSLGGSDRARGYWRSQSEDGVRPRVELEDAKAELLAPSYLVGIGSSGIRRRGRLLSELQRGCGDRQNRLPYCSNKRSSFGRADGRSRSEFRGRRDTRGMAVDRLPICGAVPGGLPIFVREADRALAHRPNFLVGLHRRVDLLVLRSDDLFGRLSQLNWAMT